MWSEQSEEGVSQPVPCQIEQCQTARRTLAQTETLLPLTGTDGVSHAYCGEGYVTSLPCCLLNLIRSTEVREHIYALVGTQTKILKRNSGEWSV